MLQPAAAQTAVELNISGIEGTMLDNVRAYLGLSEYAAADKGFRLTGHDRDKSRKPPSAQTIHGLHRRADEEIRQALQPFGYYEPVIQSTLRQDGERWIADYAIDPGPPTLLAAIDIRVQGEGAGEANLEQARAESKLRAGERLEHTRYEETRKALIRAALAAGYLDASYTRSELRVTPAEQRADVILHLETGPRYYFGEVSIEQSILSPAFVERYIKIKKGDPFDTERLLALQLALGDSGYFKKVETDARRDEAHDQHVPVTINTTPGAYVRYSAGAGFATDTGPRISLGADFRRLNRRGHGLKSDLRLSPIEQIAAVQYRIPIRNLLSDRLIYGGSIENAEVANEGDSQRFRLAISQNVSWGKYQRRLYLDYQHESFTLGNEDDTVNFLIPGASLSRLHADNVLFPRHGYSWNIDLRGSPGLVSSTRYIRIGAALRTVYPLGDKVRLIARTALGATSVDDFSSLPTSERFFAGGDQSVRGYGYQELAPVDSSGEEIGGQYLATGTLEVDYLFAGNFGGAVFVDAGNADDTFLPALKVGAGVGFRWRSPVGMLRIDLAHPFDAEDNFRLHFSIGPDL
jgi:translocation and assembly module TamA